jgi:hypothetical protein
MGPVAPSLFVATTLLLAIAVCIDQYSASFVPKEQICQKTFPIILQMLGASCLVVGAFQSHGLSKFLSSLSDSQLNWLNMGIGTFSLIAAAGAFYIAWSMSKSSRNDDFDNHDNDFDNHDNTTQGGINITTEDSKKIT